MDLPAQDSSLLVDGAPSLGVALGFRRLSIIDLQLGHQPLGNEDGSVQIVFNGEVYNYKELRQTTRGIWSHLSNPLRYRDDSSSLRRPRYRML
jgi:asparagine synthetase B (glutamine-hydrolysing)